jgi:hypothetical protein
MKVEFLILNNFIKVFQCPNQVIKSA